MRGRLGVVQGNDEGAVLRGEGGVPVVVILGFAQDEAASMDGEEQRQPALGLRLGEEDTISILVSAHRFDG